MLRGLTQSELAKKVGLSRVQINQYLSLLKLPKEQQDYIVAHGKAEQITERRIRKSMKKNPALPQDQKEHQE